MMMSNTIVAWQITSARRKNESHNNKNKVEARIVPWILTQSAAQTLTRRSAVAINQWGERVLKLRAVTAAALFLWSDITLMINPVSELITEAKPMLSPDTSTWPEGDLRGFGVCGGARNPRTWLPLDLVADVFYLKSQLISIIPK